MHQKILYFNQKHLDHPEISNFLDAHYDYPWDLFKELNKFFNSMPAIYPRVGINGLPFKNDVANLSGFDMPRYDNSFSRNFQEVTDQRCLELRSSKFNRPWIVYYSGGIDSTVMVCSIIKNLPKADWKNITIACNSSSIYEYPEFYFKFILPNFTVTNSNRIYNQPFSDSNWYIDGEFGDQLYGGGEHTLSLTANNPELLHCDIVRDAGKLIGFLKSRTNQRFAEWYYHLMLDNIRSVDLPLETFNDFFWWGFFNYSWISVKFRPLFDKNKRQLNHVKTYLDTHISWYDNRDYQLWSMINNIKHRDHQKNIGDFKKHSKNFIYEVTKDTYYRIFKIKTGSTSISVPSNVSVISEDLETFDLANDIDQILRILPHHLNIKRKYS